MRGGSSGEFAQLVFTIKLVALSSIGRTASARGHVHDSFHTLAGRQLCRRQCDRAHTGQTSALPDPDHGDAERRGRSEKRPAASNTLKHFAIQKKE